MCATFLYCIFNKYVIPISHEMLCIPRTSDNHVFFSSIIYLFRMKKKKETGGFEIIIFFCLLSCVIVILKILLVAFIIGTRHWDQCSTFSWWIARRIFALQMLIRKLSTKTAEWHIFDKRRVIYLKNGTVFLRETQYA